MSAEEAKNRALSGEAVSYKSNRTDLDGDAQGFLYNAQGTGNGGIIMIHEWWGVNDFAHNAASRMAESGFCILTADVFRGFVFKTHPDARKNMMSMNYPQAAMDIAAAAEYLRSIGCQKIGVMGFGFGGNLSLVSASLHPDHFDAVAPNCGVSRPDLADVSKIKAKVQGHYAIDDVVKGVASPEDVKGLQERMTPGNVDFEVVWYKAKHAFTVPDYEAFNPEAREEFFKNVTAFFKRELSA